MRDESCGTGRTLRSSRQSRKHISKEVTGRWTLLGRKQNEGELVGTWSGVGAGASGKATGETVHS